MTISKTRNAILITFVGAFFYFYQFFLRNAPGVIGANLIEDFGISATMLGLFSSAYYFAYAPLQIPMGVLLDNFGPKKVMLIGSSMCVAGVLLLSIAPSFPIAFLARFLIGVGAATSFIGPVRVSSLWFSHGHIAFVIGLISATGKIGGAFSGFVLPSFMGMFLSWKVAFMVLGLMGVPIIFLMLKVVKDTPDGKFVPASATFTLKGSMEQLMVVLKEPIIWITGIYGYSFYLPLAVFSDMWAPPFLKALYNVSLQEASSMKSAILIGSCVGGPACAFWSDTIKSRTTVMKISSALAVIITIFLLFFPPSSKFLACTLMFFMGFFCASMILVFAISNESIPKHLSGTATGVANMFTMLGGIIHTPLIGWILDLSWDGKRDAANAPIYSLLNYQLAFGSMLFMFCISFIVSFIIPETFYKRNA